MVAPFRRPCQEQRTESSTQETTDDKHQELVTRQIRVNPEATGHRDAVAGRREQEQAREESHLSGDPTPHVHNPGAESRKDDAHATAEQKQGGEPRSLAPEERVEILHARALKRKLLTQPRTDYDGRQSQADPQDPQNRPESEPARSDSLLSHRNQAAESVQQRILGCLVGACR